MGEGKPVLRARTAGECCGEREQKSHKTERKYRPLVTLGRRKDV